MSRSKIQGQAGVAAGIIGVVIVATLALNYFTTPYFSGSGKQIAISGKVTAASSLTPPDGCTPITLAATAEYQSRKADWDQWSAQSEGSCKLSPGSSVPSDCWKSDTAAISAGTGGGANSVQICWYGKKTSSATSAVATITTVGSAPSGCSAVDQWSAPLGNSISKDAWD